MMSESAANFQFKDRIGLLVSFSWLLSTHQGAVDREHLESYLNEFVFRFNRRNSRSRGLVFHRVLELAVDHDPVRYRHLVIRAFGHQLARRVQKMPPGRWGFIDARSTPGRNDRAARNDIPLCPGSPERPVQPGGPAEH